MGAKTGLGPPIGTIRKFAIEFEIRGLKQGEHLKYCACAIRVRFPYGSVR